MQVGERMITKARTGARSRAQFHGRSVAAVFLFTMSGLAPQMPVQAACTPAGGPHGDMIVCTGDDTAGVTAGPGNDTVTVSPGASVTRDATTSVTAIDTGPGNDTVVNDGRVSATVTINSTSKPSAGCPTTPSGVTAVGVAGGTGNDRISNRGTVSAQTSEIGRA